MLRLIFAILKGLFYFFFFIFILVLVSNLWILQSTHDSVFFDYRKLPDYHVALVLGTSPLLTNGTPNPFFYHRLETVAMLYKKGCITHLIVSGDNRTKYYNEPIQMKKKLLELGIPASAITLDYEGLRTLDSVVRSKEIFGQKKIIIITQAFHSYRALFIAKYYGMDAVAFATAKPVSYTFELVYWREYLARTKAILDLYVLKMKPHYLKKNL